MIRAFRLEGRGEYDLFVEFAGTKTVKFDLPRDLPPDHPVAVALLAWHSEQLLANARAATGPVDLPF